MKISKENQQLIHEAISKVLETGEGWEDESLHFPVGELVDVVSHLGLIKDEDGFDTNGWQWDWWQRFTDKKGQLWILAGSGYYGGVSFAKEEE